MQLFPNNKTYLGMDKNILSSTTLPSWDLCVSDVNRLRHWRMHVRKSYICSMVFHVSSTSRIAYVTITIISEDSANPCLFQQSASDINNLAYVTGA